MKTPKRALKCQETINKLVNLLDYYMGHSNEFKKLVREDVQFLEDYIIEISKSKKLSDIKLTEVIKKGMK